MARKKDGRALFEAFYFAQYGNEWFELYEALKQERTGYLTLTSQKGDGFESISGIDITNEAEGYHVDRASIYPVLALGLNGANQILDAWNDPGC